METIRHLYKLGNLTNYNNYEEVIIDYNGFNIRKIISPHCEYYYATDIGAACSIKQICVHIANFNKDEVIKAKEINYPAKRRYKNETRNDFSTLLLTHKGVNRLISISRSINMDDFAKFFGASVYNRFTPIESETIKYITTAFKNHKYYLQFIPPTTTYRIDLYFPDINLAIECDEHGHSDRDPGYEIKRETEIKEKINCEFIRYNPDSEDFDIFELINQIHMYILNKGANLARNV